MQLSPEAVSHALETLELPPFVSKEEIKRHYRYLVKKFHPDKGGDASRFREINEAYRTLMTYIERYRYSFDEEEMKRQLSGAGYDKQFEL